MKETTANDTRLLSVLFAVLVLVLACTLLLPRDVKAAGEGLTFQINDGSDSYSVSDCDSSVAGTVTVPGTYNGKPVTAIGENAFRGCSGITAITLPDSITSIGDSAFYNCTGLTELVLPEKVVYIGSYAFSGCEQLKKLSVPTGLQNMGVEVFSGCDRLEYKNSGNVLYLGNAVNPYVIAVSHKSGNQQFQIHKDTKIIYDYAFHADYTLYGITLPEGLVRIGNSAFDKCTVLTEIAIPEGVVTIGDSAFYECYRMEKITLPSTLKSIGGNTFFNCPALKDVYISDIVAWWNVEFYDDYSTPLFFAERVHLMNADGTEITKLTLDKAMRKIPAGAFEKFAGLTQVTIPETVTAIGDYAFAGCTGLTEITIPASVTVIGTGAFRNCTGLTGATIGSGVKEIGGWAFENCSGLASVTMGKGLTVIGGSAFSGCNRLEKVFYTGTRTQWDSISLQEGNQELTDANLYTDYTGETTWYTVVFKNWNGEILSSVTYRKGDAVKQPANPTKPADNVYAYTFSGWDKEVVACDGDATYTATYSQDYVEYTVVFKNWDGTVLKTLKLQYEDPVTAPENPTRPEDDTAVYTFSGWDKALAPCTGNATYTAQYTAEYKDPPVVPPTTGTEPSGATEPSEPSVTPTEPQEDGNGDFTTRIITAACVIAVALVVGYVMKKTKEK